MGGGGGTSPRHSDSDADMYFFYSIILYERVMFIDDD